VLFRRRAAPSRTAIVVPVVEADSLLAAAGIPRERAVPRGMPLHVTALFPFMPPRDVDDETLAALRRLAAQTAPFAFTLASVERFAGGVLYLALDPAQPFVALTAALVARWPRWPPYGGAFDEVVPHLTVVTGEEPPGVAAALESALPVPARASKLWLMAEERDGSWSARARLPLGS
jgi:2'-5' RNA ligase